jgi:hypothetical protein
MQYFTESSSGLSTETQEIVEIKLWGLYLLLNPGNLYNQIIEASLDHGPVEKNPQKPGRVTFRFNVGEWEGKVKKLLYSNRIPVVMTSSLSHHVSSFAKRRIVA